MLYHKVQKALTFYLILWVSLLSCVRDLSYILLFKLDNLQQYITWFEVGVGITYRLVNPAPTRKSSLLRMFTMYCFKKLININAGDLPFTRNNRLI